MTVWSFANPVRNFYRLIVLLFSLISLTFTALNMVFGQWILTLHLYSPGVCFTHERAFTSYFISTSIWQHHLLIFLHVSSIMRQQISQHIVIQVHLNFTPIQDLKTKRAWCYGETIPNSPRYTRMQCRWLFSRESCQYRATRNSLQCACSSLHIAK